jgi:hypothetical protein
MVRSNDRLMLIVSCTGVTAERAQQNGSRMWQPLERAAVVERMRLYQSRFKGAPPPKDELYAIIANKLRVERPDTFGPGSAGKTDGISRQDVRSILMQSDRVDEPDGRGRPFTLPDNVLTAVILALTAVVSTKATLFSAGMLQPIA